VIEQLITSSSISPPLSSVVMVTVMLVVSLPAGREVIILVSVTVPFVAISIAVSVTVTVPIALAVPVAVSVPVSIAIPVTVPAGVPRSYRLTITTAAATHAAVAVKHRPIAAVRGSVIVI
jgi:hypothetical protein